MTENRDDIIMVECPCGDNHQFAQLFSGRLAKCPKLKRRFRVPNKSGPVAFIVDSHPTSAKREDEVDAQPAPRPKAGWPIKRVTDLYHDHKAKRELYRQTHCRCLHCKVENLTAHFMCAKCGCPLHDQHAAFLFMEKRRQEAHELKVAQAQGARDLGTPSSARREVSPPPPVHASPPVVQKVVVHGGSGCLSIIGGIVVIILILLMIPICFAPFLVSSNNEQTDMYERAVSSASPARPERLRMQRNGASLTPPQSAAPEKTNKWILEIEPLKLYQTSRSHAAIDMRFINSSPNQIQHWIVNVEVYDNEGNYLARGEGMVSHINAGQSKVEEIFIPNTQASQNVCEKVPFCR